MMKTEFLALVAAAAVFSGPAVGKSASPKPPKGAVVLFDGSDTSQWKNGRMENGFLREGTETKDRFGDCLLHLEFNIQPPPKGKRNSGNSGVYLQRRYEIQILDSFGKEASSGDCGAIYRQKPPDTNAAKPRGQWQTLEIEFRRPRWDGDKKTENARLTVVHNGVKIHDNVEVSGKTGHGRPEGPEPGPIYLQSHGAKIYFRNIWVLPR